MPGNESPGACSLLYSGKQQSGTVLACGGTKSGPRYNRWYPEQMEANEAAFNTRSVTVFSTTSGASALLFFDGSYLWGSPFSSGTFLQFTNAHPLLQWDADIPSSFYSSEFPDAPMTGSMLIVQTQRTEEIRRSFRDALTGIWNEFAGAHLPDQVVLKGTPVLRWMPFPKDQDYLNEDQIYLFFQQEIEIVLGWWWSNYAARISFWLHLDVNDGQVTGHVQRWQYWIEGGPFTSIVKAILKPNLELAVPDLNDALNQALSALPSNVTGVYYLPGRQLNQIGSGYFNLHRQSVKHDVTMIFELG